MQWWLDHADARSSRPGNFEHIYIRCILTTPTQSLSAVPLEDGRQEQKRVSPEMTLGAAVQGPKYGPALSRETATGGGRETTVLVLDIDPRRWVCLHLLSSMAEDTWRGSG